MGIDRGPWNALVDDDGSNLVGTIWNKDKIKTVILDPVDGLVQPAWIAAPFDTADYVGGAGGTWTVAAAGNVSHANYCVVGKICYFSMSLSGTVIGGAPASLQRKMFGGLAIAKATNGLFIYNGGAAMWTTTTGAGSVINFFTNFIGTAWAASTIGLRVQGFVEIS
jgi:hypothetical protein